MVWHFWRIFFRLVAGTHHEIDFSRRELGTR